MGKSKRKHEPNPDNRRCGLCNARTTNNVRPAEDKRGYVRRCDRCDAWDPNVAVAHVQEHPVVAFGKPCRMWRGARSGSGYGCVRRAGKVVGAHVAALEDHLGRPVAPGHHVHHLCNVKLCVEPTHLAEMTPTEHVRWHAADITHCPKGHLHDYRAPNGGRICRLCARDRMRALRARRRESAA